MNKKYQVFVSSTYEDLKDERKKVANAIFKADHIPVGMETFPATTRHQWQMITELIDTSDYYVLIIGGKYGSISPAFDPADPREISYTQREYEYARSKDVPVYTFICGDIETLAENKREKKEKSRKKLQAFIKTIKANHYCDHWHNAEELSRKVLNALNHAFRVNPRAGWVRSNRLWDAADDYNSDVEIIEKTIYYKFLHLSNKATSSQPLYRKYVERLNETIDIYDEYMTFRISNFNKLVTKFRSYDSTRGTAVEVKSLLPYIRNPRDTDITVEENPRIIQPMIKGASNVFVTSSHYYNGFQPGNKDTAAKADKNAQTIRLVVDFTSIKDYHLHIRMRPKVFFSFYEEKGKLVSKEIGTIEAISPGLFEVERKNMKEGEVIRIEFASDFDTTSNIS
ncbi:DUF4062 domain-containing protein [Dyadobacter aurulentus]|uniref:DUF4062 domain-containing protein n=1 Tax=Dyadobacter sp. UC 10 TaxID=2605428 RepID=UPI0011F30A3C|nr:DUF4062 domain-containing protein [Dyadobacter sp. UC 10]KAA0992970.1 DUF4062 domain-containing protein [Dyadobacter sp. UC 10]